ncbi:MAG: DUF2283 domain-containing protein [Nanoarchaeota archaeon]|nr:DUF2283 domain-containing protein [Nanoarchaeota archaeon]MBU1501396.1 DUF2283 domain-containing protein [Nanoarchaeota archaeon]MBU2459063.1 DUF2283 domain-containing protein [Nanoarchaeota archaeon]
MEQWYDKEEDILGIRLKAEDYWKSVELPNGIVIDLSKEGNIIGMEIFNASKLLLGDAKKVIESSESLS